MAGNVTVCLTGDIDDFKTETVEGCLEPYFKILQKYQVKMTIPITAKAVKDYPERAEFIVKQGHEVAIHGDVHQPFYGSVEEQVDRLEQAKQIYQDILGFVPTGFRAPWLRHDKNTYLALIKTGFFYDSSQHRWELPPIPVKPPFVSIFPYDWGALPLMKPFLHSITNLRRFVNPLRHPQANPFYFHNQLVELPITSPDDYRMISHKKGPRYSPEQAHRIGEVWLDIVRDMRKRKKQLFVVQAHPGRMSPSHVEAIEVFLAGISNDSSVKTKLLKEVAESFIAETKMSVQLTELKEVMHN